MTENFFSSNDLIWTKNVKRERGNAWAYMEFEVGSLFYLNWAKGRADMGRTDARKAKVNDLILIFQTVNKNAGYTQGTYLTHIVTPIDTVVYKDEDGTHPYKRLVTVVARSINPIPKPKEFDFREPNRGWLCGLDSIKPFKNRNTSVSVVEKQQIFWNLFTNKDPRIKDSNKVGEALAQLEQSEGSLEGAEKFWIGRHKYYERDPKIIFLKKQTAELSGNLKCEICKFDFSYHYGLHGKGFIECHHTNPIAGNGVRKTEIEDLVLVCSNCHRMLHRKNSNGFYYTIEELKMVYKQ